MQYRICGLIVDSQYAPASFAAFVASQETASEVVITLASAADPIHDDPVAKHRDFNVHRRGDGWLYHAIEGGEQLSTNADYSRIALWMPDGEAEGRDVRVLLLLRIAIECRLARQGVVSLHAACICRQGEAVAFTAPSGTGKSTRAANWVDALRADWISGDRPAINVAEFRAYGVPWDGKEQLFVNGNAPLRAVLDVRRGHTTLLRRLSFAQARRVLMQQCFLPMWDSETAMLVVQSIMRLARSGRAYRLVCDRDEQAARDACDILYHTPEKIKEEALDMKIKEGFVLRNLVGEYMVMPTGENVAKFEGSVVLNEVSAFLFEKLESPIAEADLLELLLAEYDVDRETAQADLTALLNQFRAYGMLEEQA